MNRHGLGGWALTLLLSGALIAVMLGGFFYAYIGFSAKISSARTVHATLEGLATSDRALLLLRLPVGDATVAELLANGNTAQAAQVLRAGIKDAFGDAACRLRVDGEAVDVGCASLSFADASVSITLPAYGLSEHAISLEVGR